jgi:hypothetical protein
MIHETSRNKWAVDLHKSDLTDTVAATRAAELKDFLVSFKAANKEPAVLDSVNLYQNSNLTDAGVKKILDVAADHAGWVKRIKIYANKKAGRVQGMQVIADFIRRTAARGIVSEIHVTEMMVTDVGLKVVLDALEEVLSASTSKTPPVWLQVRNNCLTKAFVEGLCCKTGAPGCLGNGGRDFCGTDKCRYGCRFHLFGGKEGQRPQDAPVENPPSTSAGVEIGPPPPRADKPHEMRGWADSPEKASEPHDGSDATTSEFQFQ